MYMAEDIPEAQRGGGRPLVKERVQSCLNAIHGDENSPFYQLSQEKLLFEFEERFPKLRLSRGTLQNAKNGRNVQHRTAQALAALFGCSAAFLYGDSDETRPQLVPADQFAQSIASLSDEAMTDLVQRILDHLIDYGSVEDAEYDDLEAKARRVERLKEDLRLGRVPSNPSKPEGIYKGIPKFFWQEETRTRKIAINAFFFVSPKERLEAPSEDWRDAFRMYASKASDPKLQTLWSRVLGCEMKRPGAISMKTLPLLPTLNSQIAQNFVRFCGALFEVDETFVYIRPQDDKGPNHYLAMFDLCYNDVLSLDEFGLVSLNHRAFDISKGCAFRYADHGFDAQEDFRISVNTLTLVGRELRPIVSPSSSMEYFKGTHRSLGRRVSRYRKYSG